MRRTAVLIFVVGLCSLAVLLIWRHYEAAGQQPSAARRVFPKVKTDRLLWPTDHTWIWAVDMPPEGQKRQDLSVVARAIHAPLRQGIACDPHSCHLEARESGHAFFRTLGYNSRRSGDGLRAVD